MENERESIQKQVQKQRKISWHLRWPLMKWSITKVDKGDEAFRIRAKELFVSLVPAAINHNHDSRWLRCCRTFKRHGRKKIEHNQQGESLIKIIINLKNTKDGLELEDKFANWLSKECEDKEDPSKLILPTVNMLHQEVNREPSPEIHAEEEPEKDDHPEDQVKEIKEESYEVKSLKFDLQLAEQRAEQYRCMLAEVREEKTKQEAELKQKYDDHLSKCKKTEARLSIQLNWAKAKVRDMRMHSNTIITDKRRALCKNDDLIRQLNEIKKQNCVLRRNVDEMEATLGKRCKYCKAGKPLPSDADMFSKWLSKKKNTHVPLN